MNNPSTDICRRVSLELGNAFEVEKLSTPKKFAIRYTVEGAGAFPLDMLRYDGATFATEPDAGAAQHYPGDRPAVRQVRLVAYVADRMWRPNVARWRSFGWMVVGGAK